MVPAVAPVAECRCAATFPAGLRDFDRRQAELLGWHEIHSLVDSLTPEELLEPGYYSEGWTVRDLMAHLGAWLAEGGLLLEQIRAGTYQEGELDVEATNQRFYDLTEGIPFDLVYVQGWASRWRMLGVWRELPEITDAAAGWLEKVGAQHYEEHLPRLRQWVAELIGRRRSETRR